MSSNPSSGHRRLQLGEQFHSIFGASPAVHVQAPGRVNLIGEHVDYQQGLVMPAAIDRYIFGSARAIPEAEVRVWSSRGGDQVTIPLDRSSPFSGADQWLNYVFGVVAKYREAGHPIHGFEAAFTSDLPTGAGLSSSAALESATALLLEGLVGIELPPTERASLCQAAEHNWAGVPCGIMDQLAVNAGIDRRALRIDCRTLDLTPVALPSDIALVVVDSKVHHALADSEYAKRRADCETAAGILNATSLRDITLKQLNAARPSLGEPIFRRAHHVVTEIDRVREFSTALDSEDTSAAGDLMAASHRSLRDGYEVSCVELDRLVELAFDLRAIGSRMMGGGFGGSTINLVGADGAAEFAEQMVSRYHSLHGGEVEAFVVNPVAGATRIESA